MTPTCDSPDCKEPQAEGCKLCVDCRARVLAWIDEQYDGIDLEHHERPPHTYDGRTAFFHYIECRRDKQ